MSDRTEKSASLIEKAQQVIPGGVNSPVRAFKSVGGVPRFIERAHGPYFIDVDDNRYLDFCCSWGPLILGHADADVVKAVMNQAERGMTYGAPTEVEYKLAQFIVDHVEHVEKIRFVSSGTEAVMSAVRLARGFTRRDLILKFEGCYHGHSDYLLVQAGSGLATFGEPSSAGVPEAFTSLTAILPLDNQEKLEEFFAVNGDRLAAAIIEGVPANNGLLIQRPSFMRKLRSLCEKHGALLILDEVITGFRLEMGGAAALYEITPDLTTFGKIIGGGMPVGAFGGRADIMNMLSPEGPVYQAGTLSGNPVAMAAGLATLEKLADGQLYMDLELRTNKLVSYLRSSLLDKQVHVASIGSIFWLVFQDELPHAAHKVDTTGIERFNAIHGPLLETGVYLPPSGYEVSFVSTVHTDEMLTEAADKILMVIAEHGASGRV
ncbi:MAG: glutamate-1-semialdehyde 2,1-aminomutase [candidate division Zixibacteria bacterium]|nr:glutamate-1-semialdehyde 2,1-aminomutase [candidate division Zixibacteria bacterium]